MTSRASMAVAGLAVSLMVAGCSDFGDDTGAESSTTSTTTSPAAAPPPVGADELDICGLLTDEEAAAAIDAPSVATEAWYFEAEETLSATAGCTYESEDAESPSKIVVYAQVFQRAGSALIYFEDIMRRNDYPEAGGLGDRALVPIEDVGDFYVVSGAYLLTVSVERADEDASPSDDDGLARELVELVLSRLPAGA